jgi:hypothetical protein
VAVGLVQAKATYIIWPLCRWGKVHTIMPDDRGPLTIKECEEINKLKPNSSVIEISDEESIAKDLNGLKFADYESMSDYSLLPGKFGPVS